MRHHRLKNLTEEQLYNLPHLLEEFALVYQQEHQAFPKEIFFNLYQRTILAGNQDRFNTLNRILKKELDLNQYHQLLKKAIHYNETQMAITLIERISNFSCPPNRTSWFEQMNHASEGGNITILISLMQMPEAPFTSTDMDTLQDIFQKCAKHNHIFFKKNEKDFFNDEKIQQEWMQIKSLFEKTFFQNVLNNQKQNKSSMRKRL